MAKKQNKIILIVLIVLTILVMNGTIDLSNVFSVSSNIPSGGSLVGGGGG